MRLTKFLLIRHATNDTVGRRIAGRSAGVHLNAEGESQANRLALRLGRVPISAIYSSPLERARETAERIAAERHLSVEICESVAELAYGDWTGKRFSDLNRDPAWNRFNSFRSNTQIPGGELMMEAQSRAVAEVVRLQARHPGQSVVLVTHSDIIRALIGHYAGIAIDLLQRLEIEPASVTVIAVDENHCRILCVNHTGDLAELFRPAAKELAATARLSEEERLDRSGDVVERTQ